MDEKSRLRKIRFVLLVFISGLIVAGMTAIPLRFELGILDSLLGEDTRIAQAWPPMGLWISRVHQALNDMDSSAPFLAYGYDWLAFGHFVIAIAFFGPYRDPVRNRWVIDFGMIACALVIPYAVILGEVRGIPVFWRFIDTLFGIIGFALLWYVHSELKKIDQIFT
jgi:hypothetical protein